MEGGMKLKPLFDRVVILPEQKENVTSSGIILPGSSQEMPQIGKIIAVGDGESLELDRVKMKVKVGDKVLYNKYAGSEIKLDGKTYIIMRQIDLVGVIDE